MLPIDPTLINLLVVQQAICQIDPATGEIKMVLK